MPPPSNVALTALDDDAGQGVGLSIPRLRSAEFCALSIETPLPASSGDVVPMPPDVVVPDCAEQGAMPGAMVASIKAVRKSLVRTPATRECCGRNATRNSQRRSTGLEQRYASGKAPASPRPAGTAAAETVQGAVREAANVAEPGQPLDLGFRQRRHQLDGSAHCESVSRR
jgi:hypothetical protein